MTGADLVDQLHRAARERDVPLARFIAPLASARTKYLQQLRLARTPKPETIARVRALIEGRPLPPAANAAPGFGSAGEAGGEARRAGQVIDARELLERRRALAEYAAAMRLPGETLHSAVGRLAPDFGLRA